MRLKWLSGLLLAAAFCAAENGGNDLFQQGLRKERSEGNYKAAIEIYRRVVKQYASDRKLAAKALLQIAHCQEREGSKEARLSYERLVREFGDQTQAVSEAKARIAAMESAPSSAPRVRQVWAGKDVDNEGSLSPDGRWLTYAHWETGDLGVRDLVNGTNKLLTNTGGWIKSGGDFAEDSRFSPDGKKIAYNWFTEKGDGYELRLMNSDGTGVRTLGWADTPGYVLPIAWSPDGKQILAEHKAQDGLSSIYLVSAASGELHTLVPPSQGWTQGASFSPDGKWIVMDGAGSENAYEADLYIIPAAGGKAEILESNPANDVRPFWSHEGASVLFASDRGGSYGLWRLPVSNGRASAPAELVKGDLGNNVVPIDFGPHKSFLYSMEIGGINSYSVEFDPATARVSSKPALVSQRFPGHSADPQPSPDGKFVAFRMQTGSRSKTGTAVVLRDRTTGNERVYAARAAHIVWTPDSKKLLFEMDGPRNSRVLAWLDAESGSITPFKTIEPCPNGLYPVFGPDGRTLYFVLRKSPINAWTIQAVDVATGEQHELYKTDQMLRGLSMSPDGRTLATLRQASDWSSGTVGYQLILAPAAGGRSAQPAPSARERRPA
jgi:Tol biopolymer transport system component